LKTTLLFVITLIFSTIGLSQTTYINYTDSINLLQMVRDCLVEVSVFSI